MLKPAVAVVTTHLITIPQHRHRHLHITSLLIIPLCPLTQVCRRRLIPTTTHRHHLMGTSIEIESETESVASGTSETPGATGIED